MTDKERIEKLEKQSEENLRLLWDSMPKTEYTFFTPEQIAKMNSNIKTTKFSIFYDALPPYLRNDFSNWVKELSQTDNN
jgi:hypothetical protein